MQTEGESRPMPFSQVFHLAPVNQSWVVTNGESAPRSVLMPPATEWQLSCTTAKSHA